MKEVVLRASEISLSHDHGAGDLREGWRSYLNCQYCRGMNGRIVENWPILKEKLRALIAIRDRADIAKEGVTGGRRDGRTARRPSHFIYGTTS